MPSARLTAVLKIVFLLTLLKLVSAFGGLPVNSRAALKSLATTLSVLFTGATYGRPQKAPSPPIASVLPEAPNYSMPESWVCRPGKESICSEDLDTLVYMPGEKAQVQHFVPDSHPSIDCFYVYPTVSGEDTPYADMRETAPVQRVVHVQAGRFSSVCRIFAPIYRQSTMRRLKLRLAGQTVPLEDFPKHDVGTFSLFRETC